MAVRRGFIILIVIGMLGVLAVLAVQLADKARISRDLSNTELQSSQVYLLARSGIERGLSEISGRMNQTPPDYSTLSTAAFSTIFTLGVTEQGTDETTVFIRDPCGMININDGVSAGNIILTSSYDSKALEAWEDSNPPLGPILKNDSGFINLRLRRLLNAYGDALLFTMDPNLGWPLPNLALPYSLPFTFSSTDAVAPYAVSPGGDGFGDHIISQRPKLGYRRIDEIRSVVNSWAVAVGLDAWLAVGDELFDLVRNDLTVDSYEDEEFWGFNNEFGEDRDSDGFPDWSDSVTVARVTTQYLDTSPPDLTSLWSSERHPVALINLNAASDLVRAAVFYAPTNVSYLCEGHFWITANTSWTQSALTYSRDSLGTGGPVFHDQQLQENGVRYNGLNDNNVQIRRLMSLRDALLWSQQYRTISQATTWPEDFNQFKERLGEIRAVTAPERGLSHQDSARNNPSTGKIVTEPTFAAILHTPRDLRFGDEKAWFTTHYIEETLPHIFSTVRRTPGFMGAPLALLSPYTQELGGATRNKKDQMLTLFEVNNNQERATKGDHVLRSVEDFVFRAPIPKVCFSSPGLFTIHSQTTADGTTAELVSDIRVMVKAFNRKIWRTQEKFAAITDSDSQNVVSAPENAGQTASNRLGCVGPVPLKGSIPGSPGYKTEMFFDSSLSPAPGYAMKPSNLAGDSFISSSDADHINTSLLNSELESTGSVFSSGSAGNDLTPFGGVMLSSRDHGTFAPDFFTDSMYF